MENKPKYSTRQNEKGLSLSFPREVKRQYVGVVVGKWTGTFSSFPPIS